MCITPFKRKRIFIRDKHTCLYCNKVLYDTPSMKLEVDHIVPKSKKGSDGTRNLVTSCSKCNKLKSDLSVRQFAQLLKKRGKDTKALVRRLKNARRRVVPLLSRHQRKRVKRRNYLEQKRDPCNHRAKKS